MRGREGLSFTDFEAYKTQLATYKAAGGNTDDDFKKEVAGKLRDKSNFSFYLGKSSGGTDQGWEDCKISINGTSYDFPVKRDEKDFWGDWTGDIIHLATDTNLVNRLNKAAHSQGSGAVENAVVYDKATNDIYMGVKNQKSGSVGWQCISTNSAGGTTEKYKNLRSAARTMLGYKTGGLADFTGPAWLDGTPSKPEYILSASQTEKFFQLIDILDGFKAGEASSGSGDNYFDIEIQVDSIASDYDVEQMAEKIKSIIYEDSMYRNVNMIHNIR
jgi:hypothetical protein